MLTVCRICAHASPSYGGLHKHLRAHGLDAFAYYAAHLDHLQERIRESVREVDAGYESACWIGPGRSTRYGGCEYKSLRVAGAPTTSFHRLSYWAFHAHLPTNTEVVMHRCDVSTCGRPEHLVLGTHLLNMTDRNAKGRQSRGDHHYRSTVSAEDVLAIRDLAGSGWSQAQLAALFKVGKSAINHIVSGRTWTHLETTAHG